MTNAELIQKIRAEIERRFIEYNNDSNHHLQAAEDAELLSFLSTLEESEKPMNQEEDFRGEIREWVDLMVGASFPEQDGDYISEEDYRSVIKQTARHFAQWGAEHLANSNDEVVINGHKVAYDKDKDAITMEETPNDLEEAADEMAIRAFPEKKSYSTVIDRVVDYNAVDRKNYRDGIIAGAKWDRSQMMQEAVEVEVTETCGISSVWFKTKQFKPGQKVKIIIVKQD